MPCCAAHSPLGPLTARVERRLLLRLSLAGNLLLMALLLLRDRSRRACALVLCLVHVPLSAGRRADSRPALRCAG